MKERSLCEAEEEQSKHALAVALASAAAAEAAVAAAQAAAAEVVRLAGTSQSDHRCEYETKELSVIKLQADTPSSHYQYKKEIHEISATKIQTAFRGYLVSFNKLFICLISPFLLTNSLVMFGCSLSEFRRTSLGNSIDLLLEE